MSSKQKAVVKDPAVEFYAKFKLMIKSLAKHFHCTDETDPEFPLSQELERTLREAELVKNVQDKEAFAKMWFEALKDFFGEFKDREAVRLLDSNHAWLERLQDAIIENNGPDLDFEYMWQELDGLDLDGNDTGTKRRSQFVAEHLRHVNAHAAISVCVPKSMLANLHRHMPGFKMDEPAAIPKLGKLLLRDMSAEDQAHFSKHKQPLLDALDLSVELENGQQTDLAGLIAHLASNPEVQAEMESA